MSNGCVQGYRVLVVDRGGTNLVGELRNISSLSWGRTMNQASTANVTIADENCSDQISLIERIEPGRHELVFFRGEDRVWEGPIDEASWRTDGLSVTASDVFAYLEGTPLTYDWIYDQGPYATTNMLERVERMITEELSNPASFWNGQMRDGTSGMVNLQGWEKFDPPANVLPYLDVRPGSVVTASRVLAFQMMLGEHLRDLARSSMNFTALGRSLIFWDSEQALGETRRVVSNDFEGGLVVTKTRKNLSTWSHAIETMESERADGSTFIPRRSWWSTPRRPWAQTNGFYGAWARITTIENSAASEEGDPETTDYDALRDAAQRDARGRYPVPLEIRPDNLRLFLDTDLPLSSLVPGVLMPVSAIWNLKPVEQMMVLNSITVSDDGNGESVHPTLLPAGEIEVL